MRTPPMRHRWPWNATGVTNAQTSIFRRLAVVDERVTCLSCERIKDSRATRERLPW